MQNKLLILVGCALLFNFMGILGCSRIDPTLIPLSSDHYEVISQKPEFEPGIAAYAALIPQTKVGEFNFNPEIIRMDKSLRDLEELGVKHDAISDAQVAANNLRKLLLPDLQNAAKNSFSALNLVNKFSKYVKKDGDLDSTKKNALRILQTSSSSGQPAEEKSLAEEFTKFFGHFTSAVERIIAKAMYRSADLVREELSAPGSRIQNHLGNIKQNIINGSLGLNNADKAKAQNYTQSAFDSANRLGDAIEDISGPVPMKMIISGHMQNLTSAVSSLVGMNLNQIPSMKPVFDSLDQDIKLLNTNLVNLDGPEANKTPSAEFENLANTAFNIIAGMSGGTNTITQETELTRLSRQVVEKNIIVLKDNPANRLLLESLGAMVASGLSDWVNLRVQDVIALKSEALMGYAETIGLQKDSESFASFVKSRAPKLYYKATEDKNLGSVFIISDTFNPNLSLEDIIIMAQDLSQGDSKVLVLSPRVEELVLNPLFANIFTSAGLSALEASIIARFMIPGEKNRQKVANLVANTLATSGELNLDNLGSMVRDVRGLLPSLDENTSSDEIIAAIRKSVEKSPDIKPHIDMNRIVDEGIIRQRPAQLTATLRVSPGRYRRGSGSGNSALAAAAQTRADDAEKLRDQSQAQSIRDNTASLGITLATDYSAAINAVITERPRDIKNRLENSLTEFKNKSEEVLAFISRLIDGKICRPTGDIKINNFNIAGSDANAAKVKIGNFLKVIKTSERDKIKSYAHSAPKISLFNTDQLSSLYRFKRSGNLLPGIHTLNCFLYKTNTHDNYKKISTKILEIRKIIKLVQSSGSAAVAGVDSDIRASVDSINNFLASVPVSNLSNSNTNFKLKDLHELDKSLLDTAGVTADKNGRMAQRLKFFLNTPTDLDVGELELFKKFNRRLYAALLAKIVGPYDQAGDDIPYWAALESASVNSADSNLTAKLKKTFKEGVDKAVRMGVAKYSQEIINKYQKMFVYLKSVDAEKFKKFYDQDIAASGFRNFFDAIGQVLFDSSGVSDLADAAKYKAAGGAAKNIVSGYLKSKLVPASVLGFLSTTPGFGATADISSGTAADQDALGGIYLKLKGLAADINRLLNEAVLLANKHSN